jgi:glutamate dehydrogenase
MSYFERVQDLPLFFWNDDEINERLRQFMVRSFNPVLRVAHEKVDTRTAAQTFGMQRVAETMLICGIYP